MTQTKMSKSACGVVFPVARIDRYLKRGKYAERVSPTASIYLSSVLEYLCIEVLELAGNACLENNRRRISPRHLALAIRQDAELNELIQNATIPSGGVLPKIHSLLLPKRSSAPPLPPIPSKQNESENLVLS